MSFSDQADVRQHRPMHQRRRRTVLPLRQVHQRQVQEGRLRTVHLRGRGFHVHGHSGPASALLRMAQELRYERNFRRSEIFLFKAFKTFNMHDSRTALVSKAGANPMKLK